MQTPGPLHTHSLNPNTNDYPNTNPRGQSPIANGNTDLQRHLSADSTITTSSLDYTERIETQSTNVSWADQVNMGDYISSPL